MLTFLASFALSLVLQMYVAAIASDQVVGVCERQRRKERADWLF
jgi:hypothetical protein